MLQAEITLDLADPGASAGFHAGLHAGHRRGCSARPARLDGATTFPSNPLWSPTRAGVFTPVLGVAGPSGLTPGRGPWRWRDPLVAAPGERTAVAGREPPARRRAPNGASSRPRAPLRSAGSMPGSERPRSSASALSAASLAGRLLSSVRQGTVHGRGPLPPRGSAVARRPASGRAAPKVPARGGLRGGRSSTVGPEWRVEPAGVASHDGRGLRAGSGPGERVGLEVPA